LGSVVNEQQGQKLQSPLDDVVRAGVFGRTVPVASSEADETWEQKKKKFRPRRERVARKRGRLRICGCKNFSPVSFGTMGGGQ